MAEIERRERGIGIEPNGLRSGAWVTLVIGAAVVVLTFLTGETGLLWLAGASFLFSAAAMRASGSDRRRQGGSSDLGFPSELPKYQTYLQEMEDRRSRIADTVKRLPPHLHEMVSDVPQQVKRLIALSRQVLERASTIQLWLNDVDETYFETERTRLRDLAGRTTDAVAKEHYHAALANLDDSTRALNAMRRAVERCDAQCTHLRHALEACYFKLTEMQHLPQAHAMEPIRLTEELRQLQSDLHSVEAALNEVFGDSESVKLPSRG